MDGRNSLLFFFIPNLQILGKMSNWEVLQIHARFATVCTSDLYPITELKMFINPLKHFRHLWRNTGLSNLMFISCRKLRKFPAQNICWIRKNIFFILLHFFLSRTVAYTHFMETVKNKFYIQAKLIMNSDFDLLYINEIVVQ